MRHRAEVAVILVMAAFALAGYTALHVMQADTPRVVVDPVTVPAVDPGTVKGQTVEPRFDTGAEWFAGFRMYCNPVQIDTQLRWQPAPGSAEGTMYKAACYALAGKIDQARAAIESLPDGMEYRAAGVVFDVGHPAADAGDELAAGPLMELVVEYWPNHYMALYHAGAAAFERGELDPAQKYLEQFLVHYDVHDGWRSEALRMLEVIAAG